MSTVFVVAAYHYQPNLPLHLQLQVQVRLLVVLTWICLLFSMYLVRCNFSYFKLFTVHRDVTWVITFTDHMGEEHIFKQCGVNIFASFTFWLLRVVKLMTPAYL